MQDLCFLLDGVKEVEGVCLLFGLQEDLALRLLRGDLVDRLQLPFPDLVVEWVLGDAGPPVSWGDAPTIVEASMSKYSLSRRNQFVAVSNLVI